MQKNRDNLKRISKSLTPGSKANTFVATAYKGFWANVCMVIVELYMTE